MRAFGIGQIWCWAATMGLAAIAQPCLLAQTDTSGVPEELDRAIGQRVEAMAVLSTQRTVQTGGYSFKLHDADGVVNRAAFTIDLGDKSTIGNTGLEWRPVLDAGVGYARFVNTFEQDALAGNEAVFNTYAASAGLGPRVYLTEDLSILPTIGALVAYNENHFVANNAAGEQIEARYDGTLVNWSAETLTTVPSIEARYETTLGDWKFDLRAGYSRYYTQPIHRSTDELSFRSESAAWALRADVDYSTGVKLLKLPIRLGVMASRTQLLDGMEEALSTNHFYRAGPRIMFDIPGGLWVLGSIGVGYTWTWGEDFSGYSIGLEFEFSL